MAPKDLIQMKVNSKLHIVDSLTLKQMGNLKDGSKNSTMPNSVHKKKKI